MRLGVNLGEPHKCPCGTLVDARGTHGLSCKQVAGRMTRHHWINDLVWRAMSWANILFQRGTKWIFTIGWQKTRWHDLDSLESWQGFSLGSQDCKFACPVLSFSFILFGRKHRWDGSREKRSQVCRPISDLLISTLWHLKPLGRSTHRRSHFSTILASVLRRFQATLVNVNLCFRDCQWHFNVSTPSLSKKLFLCLMKYLMSRSC